MNKTNRDSSDNIYTSRLFYLSIFILTFLPLVINYQYKNASLSQLNTTHSSQIETFNSERAFNHLTEVLSDIESHPVDSPQNHIVANRIISKLEGMNYRVHKQQVPSCVDSANGTAHCTIVNNLFVYIKGSQPERTILMSAHYDSVAAAPGASDAGTAVASLLTIAELLENKNDFKNSLVLLFNDGEEYGLLGARAFMAESRLKPIITDVINLDAIGSSGPSLLIETANTSYQLLDRFAKTSQTPVASSFISNIWSRIPSDTDMTIYKRNGLAGYNFINLETDPHYHTPQDNLKNVSLSSLQQHGNNAWYLLNELLDSPKEPKSKQQKIVYSDVLAIAFVLFTLNQVHLIAGLCLLLWVVSVWRLHKSKKINIKTSLRTHSLIFLVILSGAISAVVFKKASQLIVGTHEPWNQYFDLMQLFLFLSVFAVIILAGHCWSIFSSKVEKLLGICSVYTAGLLMSTLFYPDFSILFLIITLFCNIVLLLSTRRISTKHFSTIVLLLSILAGISFVPAVYHIQTMMKFFLSPAMGVLITLAVLPCLILIVTSKNKSNNRFLFGLPTLTTSSVCMILSLVIFTYIALNPTYSTLMPKDLNLSAVLKEGSRPVIAFPNDLDFKQLNHLKITTPEKIKIFPWSNTAQSSYQIKEFNEFNEFNNRIFSAKNEIEVKVFSDKTLLNINSKKDKLAGLKLYIPTSSQLNSISYHTKAVSYLDEKSKYPDFYEFHCIGERCSKLSLELDFLEPFDGKIWINRIYHHLPTNLSYLSKLRDEFASPKAKGDQTFIINSYSLREYALN